MFCLSLSTPEKERIGFQHSTTGHHNGKMTTTAPIYLNLVAQRCKHTRNHLIAVSSLVWSVSQMKNMVDLCYYNDWLSLIILRTSGNYQEGSQIQSLVQQSQKKLFSKSISNEPSHLISKAQLYPTSSGLNVVTIAGHKLIIGPLQCH